MAERREYRSSARSRRMIREAFMELLDEKVFFQCIKSGFEQRRKTLLNSLTGTAGLGKDQIREILEDAGKLYITISAYYTGEQADCGCGICYFGQLLSKDDALTKEYVQNLYHHLKVRYDALTKCGIRNDETEFLQQCLSYYHLHENSV